MIPRMDSPVVRGGAARNWAGMGLALEPPERHTGTEGSSVGQIPQPLQSIALRARQGALEALALC